MAKKYLDITKRLTGEDLEWINSRPKAFNAANTQRRAYNPKMWRWYIRLPAVMYVLFYLCGKERVLAYYMKIIRTANQPTYQLQMVNYRREYHGEKGSPIKQHYMMPDWVNKDDTRYTALRKLGMVKQHTKFLKNHRLESGARILRSFMYVVRRAILDPDSVEHKYFTDQGKFTSKEWSRVPTFTERIIEYPQLAEYLEFAAKNYKSIRYVENVPISTFDKLEEAGSLDFLVKKIALQEVTRWKRDGTL